jgi:hypothetical protein
MRSGRDTDAFFILIRSPFESCHKNHKKARFLKQKLTVYVTFYYLSLSNYKRPTYAQRDYRRGQINH